MTRRHKSAIRNPHSAMDRLVEGDDYYREGAFVVFTEAYHLRRGRCCESGCRHCPYGFAKEGRESENTGSADEETS